MTRIEAGATASKGYYFSAKRWSLHPVAVDGETLPGEPGERYLRIPLLLALVVAPAMGAAFLMFLPFVGFYLAASAALRPVTAGFRASAEGVAATMAPGWVPGEAHLTGARAERAEGGARRPSAEDRLAEVEREIARRRAARA